MAGFEFGVLEPQQREDQIAEALARVAEGDIRIVDLQFSDISGGMKALTIPANLLDYTVDEATDALVSGSMTEPVKFAEKWTWARPVRTEGWKLEGIEVVED